MSRPAEGIRVGMLGAVGGLFSVSLFLLIARVDSYYDYLAQPIGAYYYPDRSVENLWWIPVAFWHVLLSAVASLVVHRLQATGPKSNFLVWQAVGIVAFFGWLLTFSCFLGLGSLMHGDLDQASMIVKSLAPGFIAKYVATVRR